MIQDKFGVRLIRESPYELTAALYLQVSIVSQALIFVTRSQSWSFVERPGLLLLTAFVIAQLVSYYGKFNCISSSCFCKLITYSVMKFYFIIDHKDIVMLR